MALIVKLQAHFFTLMPGASKRRQVCSLSRGQPYEASLGGGGSWPSGSSGRAGRISFFLAAKYS